MRLAIVLICKNNRVYLNSKERLYTTLTWLGHLRVMRNWHDKQ